LKLKIRKKLRTASLNSEFTGSYKKSVNLQILSTLSLGRIFDRFHLHLWAFSNLPWLLRYWFDLSSNIFLCFYYCKRKNPTPTLLRISP